jgi:hypothetical protein
MDLPFCPACGSVRLAEEGGLLNGEVYRRIRCRDCRWAEPLASQSETGMTEEDAPVVIRSIPS